jgi:DNA helicase-2/ATP-dependent DNA helicase PcrA
MHQTLYNFFHPILEKRQKPQTQLFKENKKSERIEILSLDELLKIYEECWIDDWYQDKSQQEQYKILGKKILKEFHQTAQKDLPNPENLELDFNFKLEQFTIKGKIDRVDRLDDGSYEIIDYKTGKPKDENLESEDKEQLLIYQIAGQILFGEKIKKLTYYYLDNNSKISFLGTDKEVEQMKAKITKIIGEIQKSDFPPKPGMMCKYCDFFSICEYRKI